MKNILIFMCLITTSAMTQNHKVSLLDSSVKNIKYNKSNNQKMGIGPASCKGNLLLNQLPNQSNGFFSDLDCDFCGGATVIPADNFTLTADNSISEFVIFGGYFPDNMPLNPDTWSLNIHADNAGVPGAIIYSEANISAQRTATGVVLFNVDEYEFLFTLATPVDLLAGDYWIQVHNDSSASTDDFFWEVGDADTNSIADLALAFEFPVVTWDDSPNELALQICEESYNIDINLTGLAATNSVSFANGADTLTMTADGIETITQVKEGLAYGPVTITTQPDTPDQVCTISSANASGTVAGADVTIDVNCVTTQYNVDVSVTGLAATNSISFANGVDTLTLNADGTGTISTLDDESAYSLSITAQPDTPDQICTFDDPASGNLAGGDVTIGVTCVTTQYNVDISVTGLVATNSVSFANGADTLTLNADGTGTISTLDDGSAYSVSITAQPDTPDQVCTVTSGSGNLAGGDVTVVVNCVTTQYNVDVSVIGLAATNSVSFANGADVLTLNADGTGTISTLDDESAYAVSITTQPDTPNQVCTFDDPSSGNLAGGDVTIGVTCITDQHTVGVDVSDLTAGNSVILQNNGGDDLTVNADGISTFATAIDDGSAYAVSVLTQPTSPNQICLTINSSGNINGANVVVTVVCTTEQYNVDIAVTGLAATNSVSFTNGVDTLTLSADGTGTISTLDDQSAYAVTITAQPDTPNQVCTFDDPASGNLAGSDVTIGVTCVTDQHTVEVDVSGLAAGNTVTFQNNGGDDLTVNADGISTFATALDDGSAYAVTVLTQPTSPDQTCVVSSPTGILNGSNVLLTVTCTTDQYNVDVSVTGLAATNSVSFANGIDTLTLNADGTGTISTLDDGSAYSVSITAQPDTPDQVCTVTAGSGSLAGGDVTVLVNCVTTQYNVDVSVTGLAATNSVSFANGADVLTLSADGTGTISTLDDGSAYSVSITAQPDTPDQVCTVTSGSGNLAGSDVTVAVICVTTQYNVDVSVTGLAATNSVNFANGVDTLTLSADGTGTISTLDDGSAYSVSITAQPDTPDQVCTVTSGSGNLAGSDVTVAVNCVTTQYNVDVSVTGLAATNSVSFANGADTLTLSADGTGTISTLDDGSAYSVSITAQPDTPDQVCTVTSGSGNLAGSDVTVAVNCVTTQYNVDVSVTGLAATNSVSFANGADTLTLSADGTGTISTLDDGSAYSVSITAQPDTPDQVCTVTAGSGSLAGADANVSVTCVTTQYSVGATVSGLAAGNSVVLQNNGRDDLTFNADGSANFSTALDDGSAYAVTVLTQPTVPNQTCVVTASSGNLAGSNVNLTVTCTTNLYNINVDVTGLAAGNDVVLQNNAGDDLTINVDGISTFATPLEDLSAYDVTVLTQPTTPNQTCVLENESGTLAGADVIDMTLTCTINTYDINLNVTGLALTNSVSFINGADTITFNVDGLQTISTLDDESAYDVNITVQPDTPNQICTFVDPDAGNLAGGDVTINVTCITVQYTVSVDISGLAAGNSVVLQNNGADDLTAVANGISTFATPLNDGSAFNVTVLTQPSSPNQTCVVSSPTGNLNGSNVGLTVTCTTNQYNINVNVTGLATGNDVILQNNAGDDLTINADGIGTFATALDDESAYVVTVLTQPTTPNQTCVVSNGSGTLAGSDVTDIDVTCTTEQYTISVDVTGLAAGNDVILQNNTGDDLTINADGTSTFATALDDESAYVVTVLTQPTSPNQTCVLANESGTLAGADITDVTLTCTTEQYDVILNVTGLVATNTVSFLNGVDSLIFNADGSQTISTLDDESAYSVSITAQPDTPNQLCSFDDPDSGNLAGGDVTINVTCTVEQYIIGVDVIDLAAGNTVVLQNNSGDDLSVSSNGANLFTTALDDESTYDVTVLTQPTSPNQTCTVTNGSGTLAGADVTDITVTCVTETYFIGGVLTGMLNINDLLLDNNGQETELVKCNGPFVFDTPLDDLTTYSVIELMDPGSPFQDCEVTQGNGTVNGDDVIDILVSCSATTDTDYIFGEGFDCAPFVP